ncbi:hypothetical protein [Coxiella endosymbiont of Ornithodoros amblus]|uniref:hypothetical protein n=1 Tax=Coxiella endosymbiont of Ornithodoros amblus TaxID=1656166 RepID=UPI003CC72E29
MSAQVPIEQLYLEGPLRFEFARTQSRLTEIQRIAGGLLTEQKSKERMNKKAPTRFQGN